MPLESGDIKDAVMFVLMFLVFGVPAVAIAARLAIRPVVDAIVRLKGVTATAPVQGADPRINQLEAEVSRLSAEVQRLSEAESFTRQLMKSTQPTQTDRS